MAIPLEIIGLRRPDITLVWEDEHRTVYSALDLRLRCRCAHCVEEISGRPLLDPSRVPPDLVANHIELVGQYAISIHWSDGHQTGIYKFADLREACPCAACQQERVRKTRPQ